VAAISVSIPSERMNDQLWDRTVQLVRQVARELSIKLSFMLN
jgi:DNA-binding IclR family transcriptional regulator